ncbi:hypothetical protein [Endozoicomonas ascidiicola]|uniref:hypothetical protein n=1 Tax=Endozoicomonas ascidiicola TaxID=1698521 RepID=UPI000836720A|nr:hypothetical protein [Endozoicomonas ascidiicola]
MERTRKIRQGFGALLLAGVFTAISLTGSHAATQGTLGNTSTGSFSITLVVHPSAQARIGQSVMDEQGDHQIIPTDTLRFSKPVSLCVAARGMNHFSLVSDGAEGVGLTVQDTDGRLPITRQPSNPIGVERNCRESSRQLVAIPSDEFRGSTQPAVLVIQAE